MLFGVHGLPFGERARAPLAGSARRPRAVGDDDDVEVQPLGDAVDLVAHRTGIAVGLRPLRADSVEKGVVIRRRV